MKIMFFWHIVNITKCAIFIERPSVELVLIAFPVIRAPNRSVCLSVRLQLPSFIHLSRSIFGALKTRSYSPPQTERQVILYTCDACKRDDDDDGVDCYAHFVSSDREPNFLLLVRMRKGKQAGKGEKRRCCMRDGRGLPILNMIYYRS